jgi:hypothetical protein
MHSRILDFLSISLFIRNNVIYIEQKYLVGGEDTNICMACIDEIANKEKKLALFYIFYIMAFFQTMYFPSSSDIIRKDASVNYLPFSVLGI